MIDSNGGCCKDDREAGGGTCGSGRGCGCSGYGHHYKRGAFAVLGVCLSLLALAMVVTEVKGWGSVGLPAPQQATISVSGDGEAYGKPDIALVSFSVQSEGKTVAEAQEKSSTAMNAALAFLRESGVEEKDIKTTGYNFYPKYEWQEGKQVQCFAYPCPPIGGKQVLVGYEATQSVDVKIRKLEDAGKILGGLGDKGATNLSGITFAVEHPEDLKAKARKEAIDEAKEKATKLADDLGVKIVRISAYNEGGDYPVMNFARADAAMGMGGAPEKSSIDLPAGENKYVSNVTIVYEVK